MRNPKSRSNLQLACAALHPPIFILAFASIAVPAVAQSLAPAGVLRAVFLGSNPVQGKTDSRTGAVSGPANDLTREVAARLRVPFSLVGVADVSTVIEKVRNGEAEVGFLAMDPSREDEVSFSRPYSVVLNTLLVRADSPLRSAAEMDRSGLRIGVGKGISAELYLTRTLRQASLIRTGALQADEILRRLDAGEMDAWAANKQRLTEMIPGGGGFRILPDSFLAVGQSMVVAKDNRSLLTVIDRFLDDALRSGLVRKVLDAAALSGVEVAPMPVR
jgi:polar amino acid transport system substrate-binding protein